MILQVSLHLRRDISRKCVHVLRRRYGQRLLLINSVALWRKFSRHVVDEDMAHIRNIGIMAHIDAGKTTTTERMLYYSGFTKFLGNVDDGNTVTDYMEQERERGITITSAAVTLHWKKHKINLIDTPGHVDFTMEVERSLRVLDGAVAVLDASAGVEAQTLTVWRQADHYNVPRFIYLNKMDKPRASVDLCMTSIRQKLKAEPVLINLPIGEHQNFSGLVDVVSMQKIEWNTKTNPSGNVFSVKDLDKSKDVELWEKAWNLRTTLIGHLADNDDKMADIVIAESSLDKIHSSDIKSALRRATLSRKLVPVLCGSALRNIGVQPVLDAITDYLPNPKECHYEFVKFYQTDLCALAFKIIHDKFKGCLTFLRIYSGNITSSGSIYNVNRGKTEKISRLLQVTANEYHEISGAGPGNIVCIAGLQETITGDTLTNNSHTAKLASDRCESSDSSTDDDKAILAGLEVPSPVFFCSVEPPSLSAVKPLEEALACLQKEDPSFQVDFDKETGQTILRGMGELHLDIIKKRIQNDYRIDVHIGPLQIAYRETIEGSAKVDEVLDRQLDNRQHHVDMTLSVEFNPDVRRFKHVKVSYGRDDTLQHISRNHLQAVNTGIKSALSYGNNRSCFQRSLESAPDKYFGQGCHVRPGPVLSFPVIDVEVSLHKLQVRHGTSMNMLMACTSICLQKALKEAGPVLLEPMMKLQISCDKDRMHDVIGDLHKRRSHIEEVFALQELAVLDTITPLSELMGYSSILRKITSGTATFTMELSHYEKMSYIDQNKAIEKVTGFSPS